MSNSRPFLRGAVDSRIAEETPNDGARTLIRWLEAHPAGFVFLAAVAVRVACLLWLNHAPYAQGGDGPLYLSLARDIIGWREYGATSGDTTRVPLYPAFVAAHLWIFGETLAWVAVSQALLDAATAVVLMWTVAELGVGRRSWVVGMLWATYPPAILNTVVIFPQPLQVFWLSAAVLMVIRGIHQRSTRHCAAAATFWGVSCLARAGNLFFLPVLAAAPLWCHGIRSPRSFAWACRATVVMLTVGASTVLWWTARDFPENYRLQDLVANSKERRAVALLLSPIQPMPDQISAWLRGTTVADPQRATATTPPSPTTANESVETITRHWGREARRTRIKLWQTFSAPDGLVQLGCTGPPGGFWATVRARSNERQRSQALSLAVSNPCLALKSLMYVEHYALLLMAIPGFAVLTTRAPGLGVLLLLYLVYTLAAVVLGANYGDTRAAVPRFAFSVMPLPVLFCGVLLSVAFDRLARRRGGPGTHTLSAPA